MRKQSRCWTGSIIACLLLVGCGDNGEADMDADRPGTGDKPKPHPGEVVVEPSEPVLRVGEQERDTLGIVHMALSDESFPVPEGYTILIDEAFKSTSRLRFVVMPESDSVDTDAALNKQAAGEAYRSLEAAFKERIKAALQDQVVVIKTQVIELKQRASGLQSDLTSLLQSYQGLPKTDAFRERKRELDVQLDRALKQQIDLEKLSQAIQKQIERGRYPTLIRMK